jgi:cytochrome c553
MPRVLLGVALVFLSLQLVRPGLGNPGPTTELKAPSEVKQILQSSCYACHSNETHLSWFDRIAPASWLVARDVKRARMHLNFSEIGAESAARQTGALFESVNQIQMGAMPPQSYVRLHPDAIVTPAQVAVLRKYLLPASTAVRVLASPKDVATADVQYRRWVTEGGTVNPARSPNGIAYLPDYVNWKVVSITERNDTNTLKLIVGNDVAIKAIADQTVNPWPDGTTFAKVTWSQQVDQTGVVHAGEFVKVAFMIKGSKQYAATAGWGWAEWHGANLEPYGKAANFATECVACHEPLRKNDFVFTFPMQSGSPT